jgi:hypothetical protein
MNAVMEMFLCHAGAHNKLPSLVRQRYLELIRAGSKGFEAARRVGVSTSSGSLGFIDTDRPAACNRQVRNTPFLSWPIWA